MIARQNSNVTIQLMTHFKIILISVVIFNVIGCSHQPQVQALGAKNCYQKRYDTDKKRGDEVLWLSMHNGRVKGAFNFFTSYKDKRIGTFTGKMIGKGFATVNYAFTLEGQQQVVELALDYDEKKVSITGSMPSMGLDGTLNRVDCSLINNPSFHTN